MNDEHVLSKSFEADPLSKLPQPLIIEASRGLLCLSELNGLGATLEVVPWEAIAPGQRFWLTLIGYSDEGTLTLPIYTGELLTPDEVTKGLSRNITRQQLEHFAHPTGIDIILKVSLSGSQNEEDATRFSPSAVLLIKSYFEQTNFTSSLNNWTIGEDVLEGELIRLESESNQVLRYSSPSAEFKHEKTILYKNLSGLLPNRTYILYICVKQVFGGGALGVSADDGPIRYFGTIVNSWHPFSYHTIITSTNARVIISVKVDDFNFYSFDMDNITLIMQELPTPTIDKGATNLLFLNTIGTEGITYSVAPWNGIQGQKVWLTAYHDKVSYPLLEGHPLTAEEARDGLTAVLHPEDMFSLKNHSPLSFILDITRDGSVAKNDATEFKTLEVKLITDFLDRTTFNANNWNSWIPEYPAETKLTSEEGNTFARTTTSAPHGDRTVLYKSFRDLNTSSKYKFVVPMRRVDLRTHAPRFSLQNSAGDFKLPITLTSMEWTDFAIEFYPPQTNVRLDIVSLENSDGASIYDIDDICLIELKDLEI